MSQLSTFFRNLKDLMQKDQNRIHHELGERHDKSEQRLDSAEPRIDETERRLDSAEPRLDEAERRIDVATDKADKVSEELQEFHGQINARLESLDTSIGARFEELSERIDKRLDTIEERLDVRVGELSAKLESRLDAYEKAIDDRIEERFGALSSELNSNLNQRLSDLESRNDKQNEELTATLMERFETQTRMLDLRVDDRQSSLERSTDARMSSFEQGIDVRLFNREKYIDDRLVRIGDDIVARTDLLLQHADDRVDRLRQSMRALLSGKDGEVRAELQRFDALKATRRALEDIQAKAAEVFEDNSEAAKAHYFKIIEWKKEAIESLQRLSVDEKEIADYILSYVDQKDPKHLDYAQTHLKRYISTLGRIPPPQKSTARLLELGSCFFFTPAIERFAGYSKISCADWFEGAERKKEVREVRQLVGKESHKYETQLFDVEVDPFPYKDGEFQVVLCCEMLEHLSRDPMHLFFEANRILEDGGLLLVTTPNITSIRSIEGVLTGYPPYLWLKYNLNDKAQQHYHEHTPETVRVMLEAAGFLVDELETEDVWAKSNPATIELLKQLKFSTDLRGDNIFALARKAGPPKERYPDSLYVAEVPA